MFQVKGAEKTEILVVDTDRRTHDALVRSVKEAYPNEGIHEFFDPLLALKHGINNEVTLLVTSVSMRGADGPQLTRLLRQTHPKLRVVFVNDGPLRRKEDLGAMPDAVLQVPTTVAELRKAEEEWQRDNF